MEFCEYFEIYIGEDPLAYAIGKVTKGSVNQTRYWICNMIFLDLIMKISLPILLLVFYIYRNFYRRRDWTLRYMKNHVFGWLKYHSESTLAHYISDKFYLKSLFYCYSYYAFFFGFQSSMFCEMWFAKSYYTISTTSGVATA